MSEFRNQASYGAWCRRGALVALTLVFTLTGSFGPPALDAQSGNRPVQFFTWQLMSQDALEPAAAPEVRVRRRTGRRPETSRGIAARFGAAENRVNTEDHLNSETGVPLDLTAGATFAQSFQAANFGELGSLPPDPSGAAGPSQFILAANGRIRSFSRATGAPDGVMNVSTSTFFAPVRNGAGAFAPKIRYDRLAGRWFIIMATDAIPGRIMIASSNASTITPSTIWSFWAFDNSFPGTGCAVDSPTLGIDPSALYIGVIQFCDNGNTYAGTSGFVVRKTSVVDGATIAVTPFHGLAPAAGAGLYAPQGVDQEDPLAATGYFIGVDNNSFGTLMLRRVSNPGTTPTISGNIAISVSPTALPMTVRHLGNAGGAAGHLDGGDDRLTSAMIVNGRLWTTHTIGVTHTGQASASPNRNGVRWYEIGSLTGTPAILQSGTLFASGGIGSLLERNYWMPSIATSTRGRTLIGFNAAGASEYANGGVVERFTSDAANTLRAPQLFTAASAAYNPPGDPGDPARGRWWGAASSTVIDGCDGSTIWTVQQFTDTTDSYGLQVGRTVGPPPATPVSVNPAVVAHGVASLNVDVTATAAGGAAFFDPGVGWLCRLSASIPGVTVNSVTYLSPTSVRLNLSTVDASPGLKPVTIVNPDGQSASSGAIFRVTPGAFIAIDRPLAGAAVQPLTVSGWAVDGAAASGPGVDAVHVYAYPPAGNPVFLGAATYGLARPDVGAAHGARFTNSGYSLASSVVLTPGTYNVVAYSHSTASGTFNGTATVTVTVSPPAPPFGAVDTPANNAVVVGETGMTGWALDDAGISSVDIFRSPIAGEPQGGWLLLGRATLIRGARPDVAALYPNVPDNDNAGWGFMVLTNMLPNQGNGVFDLHAIATDRGGSQTVLGSRRITAANGSSTQPFGTIDTPGQGETVSGTIINFGWALTPQPRIIPIDGSTIDVLVDGVFRGHPVYNNFRADIANLFPGLRNTNGAVGYFVLDTTTLANGLHTISWVIRDDGGQVAGVGSRFFRVQN